MAVKGCNMHAVQIHLNLVGCHFGGVVWGGEEKKEEQQKSEEDGRDLLLRQNTKGGRGEGNDNDVSL